MDKELLELAAKAAGITLGEYWTPYLGSHHDHFWNPLTDDGDALRLAVLLRIEVEPWIHGNSEFARAAVCEVLVDEPHGDDPLAATRRVIVRAAAEIGRSMK